MRHTPLYDEHVRLEGKVVDFHGWALPIQFAGILQEHEHTRTRASLFDCSHMGEFRVCGAAAIEAYARLVCSDVAAIPVGRARYGAILNEQGGTIDDLITLRLADGELLVVTNAGPLAEVAELFRDAHADIADLSDETAKIDVQGPTSRDVLAACGFEVADLRYFNLKRAEWQGRPIVLSRTGYTGELGYELYVPNEAAIPLWQALLEQDGVLPAGLGARDTLRTEMGYPLSGQDTGALYTPLESRMTPFVAWDTPFVGREALIAQRDRGDYHVLVGIRTHTRRAPRPGFDLYSGENEVGVVTSGTYGPSVGHGVGLARLDCSVSEPGTTLEAGPKRIPVEVVEPPFYSQGTCRA